LLYYHVLVAAAPPFFQDTEILFDVCATCVHYLNEEGLILPLTFFHTCENFLLKLFLECDLGFLSAAKKIMYNRAV
jgi:hypothetical protein